jgi:3-dehydroquinate dehydratase-2
MTAAGTDQGPVQGTAHASAPTSDGDSAPTSQRGRAPGTAASVEGRRHGSTEPPLVLVLSGPNLDQLGVRQPEVYGSATLADHIAAATEEADRLGLRIEHHQTNHEGALVELVHGARGRAACIVVNAGALTHYSWSLHDALAAFDGPVIELHLSNPAAREPWRHVSVVAPVAAGSIAGFGQLGYRLAVQAAASLIGVGDGPPRGV